MSSNQKIILLLAVVFVIFAWFIWYFSRDITRKECIEIEMSGEYSKTIYTDNKCQAVISYDKYYPLKMNRFTDEVCIDWDLYFNEKK